MAQGDLFQLLTETRDLMAVDTEWYRTFLNVQAHTYSNSVKNVTAEFKKELDNGEGIAKDIYATHKTVFDKLIKQYVATLYQRIAKTSRSAYTIEEAAGSSATDFSITITPINLGSVGSPRMSGGTLIYDTIGSDPFKRIINDEKRTAMKPLLDAVNALLLTNYTTSTFLDTGHAELGVAEKQTYGALSTLRDKIGASDDLSKFVQSSGVLARLKLSSKWLDASKTLTVEVTDESYKANRSKASKEKDFANNTKAILEKILTKNRDWANQKSSDSLMQYIEKSLIEAAIASGGKTSVKLGKIDITPASAETQINYSAKTEDISDGGFSTTTSTVVPEKQTGFDLSILSLINQRLPPAVRANMTGSALHNRTGRFSESVRVTGVTETPQGYPSLQYTYMRSPYDVFDPVLGRDPWNTPGRDPKTLIDRSIRDVARDMAIGRFYTKRA